MTRAEPDRLVARFRATIPLGKTLVVTGHDPLGLRTCLLIGAPHAVCGGALYLRQPNGDLLGIPRACILDIRALRPGEPAPAGAHETWSAA